MNIKRLCIVLSTLLIVFQSCVASVDAMEEKTFFIDKSDDENLDAFIENNLFGLAYSYDSTLVISNMSYSSPIKVDTSSFEEETVCLVYYDNVPYATLFVYKKGNNYHASFSQEYVEEMIYLLNNSTEESPLSFYVLDGILWGTAGGICYDFKRNTTARVSDNGYQSIERNYNSVRFDPHNRIDSNRYIVQYCNWTKYYSNSNAVTGCVPMTLYNIYRNMGYSSYTSYSSYRDHLKSVLYPNNPESYSGVLTYAQIEYFLNHDHYLYGYSESGYMSENDVTTTLHTNYRYIMMINSISGSTGYHATALVGYAVDNNGVYYTVFNPFGTGSGKVTVTSSSVMTFTSNGVTYTWNAGYYNDIRL